MGVGGWYSIVGVTQKTIHINLAGAQEQNLAGVGEEQIAFAATTEVSVYEPGVSKQNAYWNFLQGCTLTWSTGVVMAV